MAETLIKAIQDLAKRAFDSVKEFFQIGSPSKGGGAIPAYGVELMSILIGIIGKTHGKTLNHGVAKEKNSFSACI